MIENERACSVLSGFRKKTCVTLFELIIRGADRKFSIHRQTQLAADASNFKRIRAVILNHFVVVTHFAARQGAGHAIEHLNNASVSIGGDKEPIVILIVLVAANNTEVRIIATGQLVGFDLYFDIAKLQPGGRNRPSALVVDRNQVTFAGIALQFINVVYNFPTSCVIAEVIFQQNVTTGFPWKLILAELNTPNR